MAGKTFLKGKYDKCMNGEWLKHIARLNLPIYQYESDKTKIIYAGYSSNKIMYSWGEDGFGKYRTLLSLTILIWQSLK